ncbi:MAG: DUF1549 and DUF1553 domain-containing protein, partial [Planctomycetes bacterium]|nr:DUF1549 and DUF1553 domain-containing protein [Planctomycetota bacterium]
DEQPEQDPRGHWAFRPPVRPPPPEGTQMAAPRHPIDAFVEARLQAEGLTPRPPAEKHVLLRRVYLDLIGLPPTRSQLHAFLADDSPDAYEAVVDRLLCDPRHGERWGRHWMDVWRYSDWYGRRAANDVRNSASQIWRWRDWIVQSLNEDKGYGRMVAEMLAGDEIAPLDVQAGYATGFLIRNYYSLNPNEWMRSNVEHTGKAFLGLTFNCAHCHDHKYDPIAQEDYFRLRAFFEPMYIRQDRVPGEADPGPFQDYQYSVLRKIQRLGAVRVFDKTPDAPTWFYTGGDERNRVEERGSIAPGVPEFLAGWLPKIEPVELPPRAWYPGLNPAIQETVLADARRAVNPPSDPPLTKGGKEGSAELAAVDATAVEVPQAVRDALATARAANVAAARAEVASVEGRIAADRGKYGETPGADASALARTASRLEREAAVRKAEAQVASHAHALAVAEAKPESDSERAKAIEAANAQLAAARKTFEGAQAAAADQTSETYSPFSPVYPQTSSGRRRALAEWITSAENPLTARVAVNHIWLRHFQAPLVATVYDFGLSGAAPTHPELLDWLAVELVESNWSMKHLHRLIVTSAAYARSSAVGDVAQNAAVDPENKLLWRMNGGRMEAEVVRDSLLYCAGRLGQTIGGQELENSESLATGRRSLYYAVYPEQGGKSPLGELFDGPEPLECYRRTKSIVPQQALALTNSELVHQLSARIVREQPPDAGTAGDDDQFVTRMFERILSRAPTDAERAVCLEALEAQRALQTATDGATAARRARESLLRALFNHNDFVTIR